MTDRRRGVVGLDADDTLWDNEPLFRDTQERFREMLVRHAPGPDIDAHLLEVERRNLALFGYGVKGFTLSLIESAIELTNGRIDAREIEQVLSWGRDMIAHPVELLDGVDEAVPELAARYRVLIITKGDLLHQESKVARSGLVDVVDGVEIVAEKDVDTYRRILDRRGVDPGRFVMAGNSVRSDVAPVLDIGGYAVHIPSGVTWALEHVDGHDGAFPVLSTIRELPAAVAEILGR